MPRRIQPPTVAVVRGDTVERDGDRRTAKGLAALVGALRGVDVVHVYGGEGALRRAALAATLAGARAVVATPEGPEGASAWWHRRFQRYVLPTQEEARRWRAAGVALGRLVVAGDDEALRAVYLEVAEMGR